MKGRRGASPGKRRRTVRTKKDRRIAIQILEWIHESIEDGNVLSAEDLKRNPGHIDGLVEQLPNGDIPEIAVLYKKTVNDFFSSMDFMSYR